MVLATTLIFNEVSGEQCSTITIVNDEIVELNETFSVLIQVSQAFVDLTINSATVTIIDEDTVRIGWVPALYTTTESSTVLVCAEIIEGQFARPVSVTYSTMDGTALGMNAHV